LRKKKKSPNLLQLMNRLIEFVNEDTIVEASKELIVLVERGMEHDHAFEVIINDSRFMCSES